MLNQTCVNHYTGFQTLAFSFHANQYQKNTELPYKVIVRIIEIIHLKSLQQFLKVFYMTIKKEKNSDNESSE